MTLRHLRRRTQRYRRPRPQLDRHALSPPASADGVGCDCLGLVRGVWRELYGAEPKPVPAYTRDWAEATGAETLLAAARRISTRSPADAAARRRARLPLCARGASPSTSAILSGSRSP